MLLFSKDRNTRKPRGTMALNSDLFLCHQWPAVPSSLRCITQGCWNWQSQEQCLCGTHLHGCSLCIPNSCISPPPTSLLPLQPLCPHSTCTVLSELISGTTSQHCHYFSLPVPQPMCKATSCAVLYNFHQGILIIFFFKHCEMFPSI